MPQQPSQKAVNQVEKLREALANVGEISFATVREYLDFLTVKHTGHKNFSKLIHAPGCPTLMEKPNHPMSAYFIQQYAELNFLALAYDMAQEVRQDPRRAYRS